MDEFDYFDSQLTVTEMRIERQKRGWTQEQLADILEVKQPDVSLMERGLQPINRNRAAKLAKIFGKEAEVFLAG